MQGPSISVDPACIDPGQVVNRTAAEAANAVINNNGLSGNAAKVLSGETRAQQMKDLGL